MNTITILLFNAMVTGSFVQICLESTEPVFDPSTQLCCGFGTTNKYNIDNQPLECCGDTTYVVETEICCNNTVVRKIDDDGEKMECCGSSHYKVSDNTTICCTPNLYEKKTYNRCCGSLLINSQTHICCSKNGNDKSYERENGKRCCGTEYYDTTTHYCSKTKSYKVLPVNTKLCNNTEFDIKKQICCRGNLYNKSESRDQCCGTTTYNESEHKCCGGESLVPASADCCGNGYFYQEKQRCCANVPVKFEKESEKCCGDSLYDSQFQGCCGRNIFNSSTSQCCLPDGAIITKDTNYKCCGRDSFDSDKEVCCTELDFMGRFEVINKASDQHDSCCAKDNLEQKHSYSSQTHRCSQNGTVIPIDDMCGDLYFNPSTDLCCRGVLDKHGNVEGRACCGVKSYDKSTHICCDLTRLISKGDKTSCEDGEEKSVLDDNTSPLPSKQNYGISKYCFQKEDDIYRRILKEKICKKKALKIKVLSQNSIMNYVIMNATIRKDIFCKEKLGMKVVEIRIPCPCQLSTPAAILVTDLNNYNRPLRLGDGDIILPWTKKLHNLLRKKCQTNIIKFNFDINIRLNDV